MRRQVAGSVIAMALAVTSPALAADAPATPGAANAAVPSAPTAAPVAAPAAPVAAPVAAAAAPTVAPVPAPAVARVAPVAPAAQAAPAVAKEAIQAPATPVAPPAPVATPAIAPATPSAENELPLALRPPTPLALAPQSEPIPWAYKFLFGAAIAAAGAIVWKKRRSLATKQATGTAVRVLGKTSMGLRGELALVEVGGMRLLVGVTPSSMQTLAVLPDEFSEAAETAEETESPRALKAATESSPAPRDLASRARALFAAIDVGPPVPPRAGVSAFAASRYADERDTDAHESAPSPASTTPKSREQGKRRPAREGREVPLEGQARGIALALGNRK